MRLQLALLLVLSALSQAISAAVVQATLPNGIAVTANFRQGAVDKPAIMLIHGFLQTREHATVAELSNGLADEGYTVLTPTLSLGIPNRDRSLSCEAIHNHTIDTDVAEIAFWVDWLKNRGIRQIMLGGHSVGALQALIYASTAPDKTVTRLELISLSDPSSTMLSGASKNQIRSQIEQKNQAGDKDIVTLPMSFCPRYTAPVPAYWSYIKWTRQDLVKRIQSSPLKITIVLGQKDNLVNDAWISQLKSTKANVAVIKEANHFFEGSGEFDLLDASNTLLK